MNRPRICATIVNNDPEAVRKVEPLVDLFEVRIDLIGDDWPELAGELKKPWIACNRPANEGGKWAGNEARRIEKLLQSIELGADIVDVELTTKNLGNIVKLIKKKTKCLISSHNLEKTPPLGTMKQIIEEQTKAGADICKLVTTARSFEDNLTILQLIRETPRKALVAFAMGPLGIASRIFCPLVGGDFTYASIERGKEAAPGQVAVTDLVRIYEMIKA
jgi:3-dehydroquinate dehydratase type I